MMMTPEERRRTQQERLRAYLFCIFPKQTSDEGKHMNPFTVAQMVDISQGLLNNNTEVVAPPRKPPPAGKMKERLRELQLYATAQGSMDKKLKKSTMEQGEGEHSEANGFFSASGSDAAPDGDSDVERLLSRISAGVPIPTTTSASPAPRPASTAPQKPSYILLNPSEAEAATPVNVSATRKDRNAKHASATPVIPTSNKFAPVLTVQCIGSEAVVMKHALYDDASVSISPRHRLSPIEGDGGMDQATIVPYSGSVSRPSSGTVVARIGTPVSEQGEQRVLPSSRAGSASKSSSGIDPFSLLPKARASSASRTAGVLVCDSSQLKISVQKEEEHRRTLPPSEKFGKYSFFDTQGVAVDLDACAPNELSSRTCIINTTPEIDLTNKIANLVSKLQPASIQILTAPLPSISRPQSSSSVVDPRFPRGAASPSPTVAAAAHHHSPGHTRAKVASPSLDKWNQFCSVPPDVRVKAALGSFQAPMQLSYKKRN